MTNAPRVRRDISDFFNGYPKESTRITYISSMRAFFRSVYGLRDAFDVIDYGNKYLSEIAEGRDWGADVRRFLAEQSTAPPKTQFVRWSTLKSFFRWAFYDDPMIEGN